MGERGLRDALILAAVACVAAGSGYWVGRGTGGSGSANDPLVAAAERALPGVDAPDDSSEASDDANGSELDRLRREIAKEQAERRRVEDALAALRRDVEALLAELPGEGEASQLAPGTSPSSNDVLAAAADAVPAPQPQKKGVSLDALVAAGFSPYEAEAIRDRIESIVLRQLGLFNKAKREGWEQTPRFAKRNREIGEEFDGLREEYGEERFDWILYATGRKNRIVVDSVYGQSAAGQAGLQPGDLIMRYDDERVFNGRELRLKTFEGEAGELVAIDYLRDGKSHRVYVPRGPVGVQLHEETLLPDRPS